jgi:superfamily II DNA or RNA helicase
VFDQELAALFVPGDPPRAGLLALIGGGQERLELVAPAGSTVRRRTVDADLVSLREALPLLLTVDPDSASPSLAAWGVAATAAVELVARGRLLPAVSGAGHGAWRIGPLDPDDARWLAGLAAALPAEAHALPVPGSRPLRVASPSALLRAFLDAVADTLVRTPAAATASAAPAFAADEPLPVGDLGAWLAEAAAPASASATTGLRLALPDEDDQPFRAVLQLRSAADPSLVVDVADLWEAPASVLSRFGVDAERDLLLALRRGARSWPPLSPVLRQAAPVFAELSVDDVADLLEDGGEALAGAGIEVLWPADLLDSRPTVRATTSSPPAVTEGGLDLESLLEVRFTASLSGENLTDAELAELADAKRSLVRMRGRWVHVDAELAARLRRRHPARLRLGAALAAALTGELDVDGEPVPFMPSGALLDLADRLRAAGDAEHVLPEPEGLQATLREYQRRGLAWLAQMCDLGLGGCLADDMGLGKTLQVIALHLHRRGSGPTLVVCPTSLLGNWQRELERFAPDVPVRRYHAGDRHLSDVADDEVVLTTYGVVRRDRPALARAGWGLVVADEAQHVKNPMSRTAKELRDIPSAARVALSGTPMENRLSDLWALLDWTTPGLLGPLPEFRSTVAVPVERHRDPAAIERLSRTVRPFLLRRRKADPGIAPELPPKTETDRVVPLTTEQQTLYKAVVDDVLAQVNGSEGIERRGRVLKLLTALKQVCNHPAQYLGQRGPVTGRSGKLEALDELLDVVLAEDESALVFTQYVGMARLLESHLRSRGVPTLFLHGGVPAARREEMVRAFQDGESPVFLLSLKAGGTGLNLTRATHVVHYDRWWNPAVEDQATDRAYRIGQDRPVQVHRMITEGTLEDRIATLLERKRELADAVVGSGEGWISELDDAELAELVTLS